jgi:hypothetical protein
MEYVCFVSWIHDTWLRARLSVQTLCIVFGACHLHYWCFGVSRKKSTDSLKPMNVSFSKQRIYGMTRANLSRPASEAKFRSSTQPTIRQEVKDEGKFHWSTSKKGERLRAVIVEPVAASIQCGSRA